MLYFADQNLLTVNVEKYSITFDPVIPLSCLNESNVKWKIPREKQTLVKTLPANKLHTLQNCSTITVNSFNCDTAYYVATPILAEGMNLQGDSPTKYKYHIIIRFIDGLLVFFFRHIS